MDVFISRIEGDSVTSSGNSVTLPTASRISVLTWSESFTSGSIVMIITDTFSMDVEVICLIPVTLFSWSSSLLVTFSSTSSGDAPGYAVVMYISPISTFGYWSRFRVLAELSPSIMIITVNSVANMWRFVKNSNIPFIAKFLLKEL